MNKLVKIDSSKIARNSSIELLKIFGLILIVLCHSVPDYGNKELISYTDFSIATNNISEFILMIFKNLGQVGNIIFITCSAYFLIDSKKVKIKKILYIMSDCFIISIIYVIIHLLFYFDKIPAKEMIKQCFPTTFGMNWFIQCYLILYIIHPYLNYVIRSLKKENLLRINIFFIMVYCIITWILGGEKFYYNKLIGFIIIYFIMAYVKIYLPNFKKNKEINKKLLLLGISGFFGVLIITDILGLNIKFFSNKMLHWKNILNPFSILIGITLFNLCSSKYFENTFINYISSVSLLFYVIHENGLFRFYTKPLFYQYVFNFGNRLAWVLLEGIILLIYGIIMSIIYKNTLQKIVYKVTDKFFYISCNIWNHIEKILLKLN